MTEKYLQEFPTGLPVKTVVDGLPGSEVVKLDQTVPQTMTGLTDGVLQLINGVIATRIANQTFTYFT
jgi:hypothetical protein